MTMLEYAKMVLKKVSFDKNLFVKEYRKFLRILSSQEVVELVQWRRVHYSSLAIA